MLRQGEGPVKAPRKVRMVSIRVMRLGGFLGRLRGLLGRPAPEPGTGAWLTPCRQVHTIGMTYSIDVLHLDPVHRILAIQTLGPWRLGRWVWDASGVLEMRAGEADRLGLRPGEAVTLIEE